MGDYKSTAYYVCCRCGDMVIGDKLYTRFNHSVCNECTVVIDNIENKNRKEFKEKIMSKFKHVFEIKQEE